MRKLALLLSTLVIALAIPAISLTAAQASGLDLGCNVQPNSNDDFPAGFCTTDRTDNNYSVTYQVQGGTGTSYAWTTPHGTTVIVGCTSTSSDCAVSVHVGTGDKTLTASVVVTQDGTNTTVSAEAFLAGVCGDEFC